MRMPQTHSEAEALQVRLERNARIAARLRFEREWKSDAASFVRSKLGKKQLEMLVADELSKRARLFEALKASLRPPAREVATAEMPTSESATLQILPNRSANNEAVRLVR